MPDGAPSRFRPLPAAVVFPNLQTVVCVLLSSGLVYACTAVIAEAAGAYVGLAAVVLLLVLAFFAAALAALIRGRTAARNAWAPVETPASADEVEDPLYRAASRALGACRRPMRQREQGVFVKDERDSAEPERTERLLASPLRWFRGNAADFIDANSVFWLNRATGHSW